MTNNDVLRKIRYAFEFNDGKLAGLFALGGLQVSQEDLNGWMRKEEEPEFKSLHDIKLARFLNGLIIDKRGKKEGQEPQAEKTLTNNIILRKLKIALNLTDTDMLAIFELENIKLSKHELSAFFRKPGQPQYRLCKDQFLRNFLHGLQKKYRKGKE